MTVRPDGSKFNFADEVLSGLGGDNLLQFREIANPHDFVFKYAFTLDPHDANSPIKRFPRKEYLVHLIDEWMTNPMLLVVKSRQMLITWLFCTLHLWDCMTHRGRISFFISKKEDDANYARDLSLLSRVSFVYDHLPEHLRARRRKRLKPACFEFPSLNSSIYGVSQDSDALRQYTATSIFWDEMAFQEHSHTAYAAVKPTIDGGGRMCGVSTPNGRHNLFYDLVHDVRRQDTRR